MSRVDPSLTQEYLSLFSGLGNVTTRIMMGLPTLYCDGQIFALISENGEIHFRSKGALAKTLRANGGRPFSYVDAKSGATRTMGYVSHPDGLDAPEDCISYARQAIEEA